MKRGHKGKEGKRKRGIREKKEEEERRMERNSKWERSWYKKRGKAGSEQKK